MGLRRAKIQHDVDFRIGEHLFQGLVDPGQGKLLCSALGPIGMPVKYAPNRQSVRKQGLKVPDVDFRNQPQPATPT